MEETEKGRQLKETQPLFSFYKGRMAVFYWPWAEVVEMDQSHQNLKTKQKKKRERERERERIGFPLHIQILDGQNKRVLNKRTMGQMPAIQVFTVVVIASNKLIGPSGSQSTPSRSRVKSSGCSVIGSQTTALLPRRVREGRRTRPQRRFFSEHGGKEEKKGG